MPVEMHTWTVECFTDRAGSPRFRIVAANGEIVAQSESYSSARKRNQTAKRFGEVAFVVRPQARQRVSTRRRA